MSAVSSSVTLSTGTSATRSATRGSFSSSITTGTSAVVASLALVGLELGLELTRLVGFELARLLGFELARLDGLEWSEEARLATFELFRVAAGLATFELFRDEAGFEERGEVFLEDGGFGCVFVAGFVVVVVVGLGFVFLGDGF